MAGFGSPAAVVEAILRLRDELSPELATTAQKVEAVGKRLDRVGDNVARLGDRMTVGLTLPIAAAGTAAFKLAADAEAASRKFEVVMGGSADRVRARLEELTATIPLTRSEMEGLAAGIQDMLVPMGVARSKAAGMSADMVALAGDLGAFNDVGTDQVLQDIQSALAGSSEPLQKYGVNSKVAALEAIALEAGLIRQGEALDEAARAQAVLLAIQRDSTDATGAAADAMNEASGQTRAMWRDLRDLGEAFGRDLLPVVTPLIADLRSLLSVFTNLDPATRQWVIRLAAVGAALGPVTSVTGRLISAGGGALEVIGKLSGTLTTTTSAAEGAAGGISLLSSKLGKGGLVAAAAAGGAALGTWINSKLEESGLTLANAADALGLYGESIAEIRADVNEAAAAHGEYKARVEESTTALRKAAPPLPPLRTEVRGLGTDARDTAGKLQELAGVTATDLPAAFAAARAHSERVEETLRDLGIPAQTLFVDTQNLTGALEGMPPVLNEMGLGVRGMTDVLGDVPPLVQETDTRMGEWISTIRTGKDWLDSLIGSVLNLVGSLIGGDGLGSALKQSMGGLAGFFSGSGGGGLGGLFEGIKGLFGGGGGGSFFGDAAKSAFDVGGGGFFSSLFGGGGASGILGSITSFLGGPLGGLAFEGIKELGKAIWGGLKSLFGGPSEEELLGRDIVHQFESDIASILDQTQLAEAGGESWKKTVIGIRDAYMILGRTEEEALKMAERLWASSKEGPEASKAVVAELGPVFQEVMARMDETGMTFTELRNSIVNDAQAATQETQAQAGSMIDAVQNRILDLQAQLETATGEEKDAIVKAIDVATQELARLMDDAEKETKDSAAIITKEFDKVALDSGDSFRRLAGDWGVMIDEIIGEAMDMQDELVGGSIIPDTVDAIEREWDRAGDAAEQFADRTLSSIDRASDGALTMAQHVRLIRSILQSGEPLGPQDMAFLHQAELEGFQTAPGQVRTVPGPPHAGRLAVVHGGEQIGRPGADDTFVATLAPGATPTQQAAWRIITAENHRARVQLKRMRCGG